MKETHTGAPSTDDIMSCQIYKHCWSLHHKKVVLTNTLNFKGKVLLGLILNKIRHFCTFWEVNLSVCQWKIWELWLVNMVLEVMLDFAPGSSEFSARWCHWCNMCVAWHNATKTAVRLTSIKQYNWSKRSVNCFMCIQWQLGSFPPPP